MKAGYLFTLARMHRARESGDVVLENNLLDELDDLWAEMTDGQRMRINEISAKVARREISSRLLRYWRGCGYAHRAGPLPGTDIPRLAVIWARHSKQACLMSRKTIQSRPCHRRYSALVPSMRHDPLPASWTSFLFVTSKSFISVWRGIELRRFRDGFHHHEWFPPSLSCSHPWPLR
jgi:hypothetical protein